MTHIASITVLDLESRGVEVVPARRVREGDVIVVGNPKGGVRELLEVILITHAPEGQRADFGGDLELQVRDCWDSTGYDLHGHDDLMIRVVTTASLPPPRRWWEGQ